jgi:CheY-like chemotaxis protein
MITKKILLADDDQDDRELFADVLSRNEKFSLCASVENGREVLAFLEGLTGDELPDIIVLDQNMPRMNGLETLAAIKQYQRYDQITVVIYSTYTDIRLTEQYKQFGATAVLTKPSKMEEYHTMLSRITDLIKQTS